MEAIKPILTGKALLQKMLDDKKSIHEAKQLNPNVTEVNGIKLIKAVPIRVATE